MCDFDTEKDMTRLEAYLKTRPLYADARKRAYADVAVEDLVGEIMSEMVKPPYYISGETPIPIQDIIEAYINKMQYLRDFAPVGKRLMFNIAIDEAERLSKLFMGKDENENQQEHD